jgi:hypothetical protein
MMITEKTEISDSMNKVIGLIPEVEKLFDNYNPDEFDAEGVQSVGDLILEMVVRFAIAKNQPEGYFTDSEYQEMEWSIKPRLQALSSNIKKYGYTAICREDDEWLDQTID